MRRPILCAVDDREWTQGVVPVAREIGRRIDAPLLLVHVRRPLWVPGASVSPGAQEELHEELRQRGEALLAWMAWEHDLDDVVLRLELGDPAGRICAVARETAAHFVVVGSRRRGPMRAALLGSVSARVVATAPSPVIVVPHGAAAPSEPSSHVLETTVGAARSRPLAFGRAMA